MEKHRMYVWQRAMNRYFLLRQAGFTANSINLAHHAAPRKTVCMAASERVKTRLRLVG
jgi:hypothetical protein